MMGLRLLCEHIFGIVAVLVCGMPLRANFPQSPTQTATLSGQASEDTDLERKITGIRETANWRFLTKEFLLQIENRQQQLHGSPVTTIGRIADDKKNPVKNALVLLRLPSNLSWKAPYEVFAATWTDETGTFKFRDQKMPWFEPMHQCSWELMVFARGFAVEVKAFHYMAIPAQIERIYLQPECFIDGVVKSQTGKVPAGIRFAIAEVADPYVYAKMDCSFLHSELAVPISPDENGKIRFGGLPAEKVVTVLSSPNMVAARVSTSDELDEKRVIAKDRPRSSMIHPYSVKTFEFKIEEEKIPNPQKADQLSPPWHPPTNGPRWVDVHVVDAETGVGVDNIGVGFGVDVNEVRLYPGSTATDKNGNARLNLPAAAVDVFIGGRRWGYETEFNQKHGLDQNVPNLDKSEWLQSLPAGRDNVELTFKIRPAKPVEILVTKEDGTPVTAELRIEHEGAYFLPYPTTGVDGKCEVPLRPVVFDAEIFAKTQDGLQGTLKVQLSMDLSKKDSVTVVVK